MCLWVHTYTHFLRELSVCISNQQRQDPAGLLCIHRSEVCVFVCVCVRACASLPLAQSSGQHTGITPAGLTTPHNTPQLPQCISISKLNIPGDFALTVRSLLPGSDTPPCWDTTPTMHRGGAHRDAHNVFASVGGRCHASVSLLLTVFIRCFQPEMLRFFSLLLNRPVCLLNHSLGSQDCGQWLIMRTRIHPV